jgi:hypothetical protein
MKTAATKLQPGWKKPVAGLEAKERRRCDCQAEQAL